LSNDLLPAPPPDETAQDAPGSTTDLVILTNFQTHFYNAFTTLLQATGQFSSPSPNMLKKYEVACAHMADAMEKAIFVETRRLASKLQKAVVFGFEEVAKHSARLEQKMEELEARLNTPVETPKVNEVASS